MPFGVRNDAPPWEGLVRALGMVFVFMGVIWLFWKHNQRTIEMLESQQIVVDPANMLTEEQKKSVRDLSRAMKSAFGLEMRLVVATEPAPLPVLDAKTVYLAVFPEHEQVQVVLPPIVERALGPGFSRHLRTEHFRPYWEEGNWQRGLGEALGMIWNALNRPEDGQVMRDDAGEQSPRGDYYRGTVGNRKQEE